MDFTIEEHNEEVHLTIIDDGDLLEFSIDEVVEEVNITIEEYNGANGIDGIDGINGEKGDKPKHEWFNTALRFENPNGTWGNYVDLKGEKGYDGASGIQSIVAGDNITIDNTDPLNPIINAEDGGTTVTNTSELINDGEDGVNPFITAQDIPTPIEQVNADWNATSGKAEILNKPTIPAPVDISGKEDIINKQNNLTPDGTGIKYPTVDAVNDGLNAKLDNPEGGVAGNVLEYDAVDGAKWSGRLTAAENEIDAEIVNRAAADNVLQGQITTEKNRNDTQDGQINANTTAIANEAVKRIEITTTASITTNTVGTITGKGQHGRHVQIKNGVNAINIECRTDSAADFMASYEHLGSADITFTAGSGSTVTDVYGGTKVLKAKDTCTLSRNGNEFNLRISNL